MDFIRELRSRSLIGESTGRAPRTCHASPSDASLTYDGWTDLSAPPRGLLLSLGRHPGWDSTRLRCIEKLQIVWKDDESAFAHFRSFMDILKHRRSVRDAAESFRARFAPASRDFRRGDRDRSIFVRGKT